MEFLNSTKADAIFDEVDGNENGVVQEDVHIWLRQRTGRKYITEVEGLAPDLDLKKIMKYWRHEFSTSVAKTKNKDGKKIIRLQGDKRDLIFNFLINENIIDKNKIKIHGF